MRLLFALVVTLAGACASAKSSAAPISASPVTSAVPSVSENFLATYDRLWAALPGVYASLGIKVNVADTTTRSVGFAGTVRRKLGVAALSTYFDCGRAQTEIIADSYDLSVIVASQVGRSSEGRLVVSTHATARARAPQFAHDVALCSSKGMLERALFDSLRARVR